MFYPENSLKKGGRFYLCWVADSWPQAFAAVTQRQLWSQDIRRICDDLLEVMNNESGRPANRFSLRLSSQLLRGLVRLYQRMVNVMLSEICLINARIMRNSNKKFNALDEAEEVERRLLPVLELPAPVREIELVPVVEERVEELIQQSGNQVANVQEITLKEAAIPEFQLPVNDGFGEENPNQAIQLLQDRTLEQMLGAPELVSLRVSDAPHEFIEKTMDSRREHHPEIELISGHDVTIFGKSTTLDVLPEEIDPKEIPIPEIPPPDLPAPTEKEPPIPEPEIVPAPEPPVAEPRPATQEPIVEELEELEERQPQARRRRKNKLIIDKTHKLTRKVIQARINNINVELRCEEYSDDIADLRVPADILLGRPARAGDRFRSNLGRALTRLFSRNLGFPVHGVREQRELEVFTLRHVQQLALASRGRRSRASPVLENIPEEPQLQEPLMPEPRQPIEPTVLNQSTVVPDLAPVDVEKDIADLLTQKLETTPQKRTALEDLNQTQTKRKRYCGYVSFRQSQSQNLALEEQEIEKENIPDNRQILPRQPMQEEPIIPEIEIQRPSDPEQQLTLMQEVELADRQIRPELPVGEESPRNRDPQEKLSSMLQEAGLADIQARPEIPVDEEPPRKRRRLGSDSSETMLGSLDRTKVSLGDSEQTTDSKKFIRDQWGTEGTMVKILKMVKSDIRPINIDSLLSFGPKIPGHSSVVAARCFTSILKLKQHGFIKVSKNADTLEVLDIFMGPKFNIP